MRDKYNLNTLPPSLAGLEDYEMDEHIMIPGMGGMNEDRSELGDSQMNLNEPPPALGSGQANISNDPSGGSNIASIPGLDLAVSVVREKKILPVKQIPSSQVQKSDEETYGITAHDPASILACVRGIVTKMIHQLPGIIPLDDLKPEKVQVYGKEIDVIRKLRNSHKIFHSLTSFILPIQLVQSSIKQFFKGLTLYTSSSTLERLKNLPTSSLTRITATTLPKTSLKITRRWRLVTMKMPRPIQIIRNTLKTKMTSRMPSGTEATSTPTIMMAVAAMTTTRATAVAPESLRYSTWTWRLQGMDTTRKIFLKSRPTVLGTTTTPTEHSGQFKIPTTNHQQTETDARVVEGADGVKFAFIYLYFFNEEPVTLVSFNKT